MADAQIKIILEDSGSSGAPGGGAPYIPPSSSAGGGSTTPSRSAGGAARSPSSALFSEFSKLASTTGMGQAASGVGSVASMSGSVAAIGAAGGAVAALAAGALVAAGSLKLFSMMVASQAKALEPYSAAVSSANARNEIRQEMMMFRRAGRIGGDVAKFEDMRGRMSDRMSDIWTEIMAQLMKLVEKFEPFINEVIEILRIAPPFIESIGEQLQMIIDALTLNWAEFAKDFDDFQSASLKLGKAIRDYIDGKKDDALGEDPWIAEFFSIADERRKWDKKPLPGGAAP